MGRVLSGRVYLSAGGDYCNISGDVQSGEPKPMDPIWPIAPDFLDKNLHKDYEDFVNVSGHDINLMRYFLGCLIKLEDVFIKVELELYVFLIMVIPCNLHLVKFSTIDKVGRGIRNKF